ncbi:hypothetical protein FD737_02930 [Pantoea sp. Seng]|nr:hypothetical protein [Pantoea sp. Seng]
MSSAAQRLNVSTAQRLNGSTAQRLNGSTAQRLNSLLLIRCANPSPRIRQSTFPHNQRDARHRSDRFQDMRMHNVLR